jgi:myo-inositol-1(or 4)-monophosphatase
MELNELCSFATAIATEAGQLITQMRRTGFEVKYKGELNMVTSADIAADTLITAAIRKRYPSHRILSEELAPEISDYSGPLWIIDPIDGTTNYAHGLLQVGVSLGFAIDGVMQVGVVEAPFLHETFAAIKGQGATLNGDTIKCRQVNELSKSLVVTGFPYERDQVAILAAQIKTILTHCQDVRRLGAASLDLSYVACGRLDAYYESVMPWDKAAGALIAREAGAMVGFSKSPTGKILPEDLNGRDMLIAAPGIFNKIKELLNS